MKLLLFLLLIPSAAAVGVSPASIELEAAPGDTISKQLWLFDNPDISSTASWITVEEDILHVSIPDSLQDGVREEFLIIKDQDIEAKLPITLHITQAVFPPALGLLISSSIVIIGLAAYGIIENNL